MRYGAEPVFKPGGGSRRHKKTPLLRERDCKGLERRIFRRSVIRPDKHERKILSLIHEPAEGNFRL